MRKLFALFVLCSAVLACDTRTGSSPTVPFTAELGTYVLRSVDGHPIPASLVPIFAGTSRSVTADTLLLTAGANIKEIFVTSTSSGTDSPVVSTDVSVARYTLIGDSLGFTSSFPFRFGKYSNGIVSLTTYGGTIYAFTRN